MLMDKIRTLRDALKIDAKIANAQVLVLQQFTGIQKLRSPNVELIVGQ